MKRSKAKMMKGSSRDNEIVSSLGETGKRDSEKSTEERGEKKAQIEIPHS
jgi:hypothetical protein